MAQMPRKPAIPKACQVRQAWTMHAFCHDRIRLAGTNTWQKGGISQPVAGPDDRLALSLIPTVKTQQNPLTLPAPCLNPCAITGV